MKVELDLLGLLGLAAGAALDALGDRALDVVLGDPALVKVLIGTSGGASGLGTGNGLDNIDLLALLADGLGSLAGLGEESLDPGLVDEVDDGAKDTGQEEVEEDATTS